MWKNRQFKESMTIKMFISRPRPTSRPRGAAARVLGHSTISTHWFPPRGCPKVTQGVARGCRHWGHWTLRARGAASWCKLSTILNRLQVDPLLTLTDRSAWKVSVSETSHRFLFQRPRRCEKRAASGQVTVQSQCRKSTMSTMGRSLRVVKN
jgi:hypothetical protein